MKCLVFCLLIPSSFAACSGNCTKDDDTGLLQFRTAVENTNAMENTEDLQETEGDWQMPLISAGEGVPYIGGPFTCGWMCRGMPVDWDPAYSGSVLAWGAYDHCRDGCMYSAAEKLGSLLTDVNTVHSNTDAFAAIRTDGSVVTWGKKQSGGEYSNTLPLKLTNVKWIVQTGNSFAALKKDGTVETFGEFVERSGSHVNPQPELSNVVHIYSNWNGFAAKDKDDNVKAWGYNRMGGDVTVPNGDIDLTNVDKVFAAKQAFAALKKDGTVVCWGHKDHGGDCKDKPLKKVISISATEEAFAALTEDGSVVTWGEKEYGGTGCIMQRTFKWDQQTWRSIYGWKVVEDISSKLKNVKTIFSNDKIFSALKDDGSVLTWGNDNWWKDKEVPDLSTMVKFYQTSKEFYAIMEDGSVKCWSGGCTYPMSQAEKLSAGNKIENVKDLTCITDNEACAALKKDGTVVTWGIDSKEVQPRLKKVKKIFGSRYDFAALTEEGQVVCWGRYCVADALKRFAWPYVTDTIIPTSTGFAALYKGALKPPPITVIEGVYLLESGHEFTISGTTLTLTDGWNVGAEFTISDFTGFTFKVNGDYGGGSATCTATAATFQPEQITFQNGQVATLQPKDEEPQYR